MGEFHEAVIIGGGPAGLTAGIYLMRAGIDAVLLERGIAGGAPLQYEHIENYPGFPEGISSRELMERMTGQARHFGLSIKEFAGVEEAFFRNGRFLTRTTDGEFESMGVIIATGAGPMKMGIPGEAELTGRGISYCATCDGMFFRGLDVAVIGGGDSAIQEGMTLANLVRRVYIVHRRDQLRAQKILQDRAFANPNMEVLWNKKPVRIEGKDQVESLVLEDTKTGEQSTLAVSGVFFYVGLVPETAFLGDLVDRDEGGFVKTQDNLCAKTEGLYIAGDVRRKTLRQVTTAVGDGALAAVNLEHYILENR